MWSNNGVTQLIMKIRPILYFLLITLIWLAAGHVCIARAQSPLLKPKEIQTRLDAYLNPYLERKDFSGVAMIVQDGSVLAQNAYGSASVKSNVPNKMGTKFRVASLSKTFTAAAIVILADRGKLRLSDPLSTFYPSFPNGQKIKLEHLLLHRSGVGELDGPQHYKNCYSAEQLVAEIGKVKPNFPPDSDDSYSNEGYNLLAAVIEKVSGETYENFLQKNIFQPLGMRDSGSFCSGSNVKELATGYTTGATPKTIEELPYAEVTQMGSGSIYSTAPDLVKWLQAVSEKRLFNIEKLRYPYGWGEREYTGNKLIEQSGLVEGFNAYMALYAPEKCYVVFLSNIQSGLFNLVPKDLKAVAFGGEYSRPPEFSGSRSSNTNLLEFIGAYRTTDIPVPLSVIFKDGNLYLRWGNYPFMRSLTPVGKEKFFHRAEYADISFERNKDGRIEKIIWRSGSNDPLILEKVPASLVNK